MIASAIVAVVVLHFTFGRHELNIHMLVEKAMVILRYGAGTIAWSAMKQIYIKNMYVKETRLFR